MKIKFIEVGQRLELTSESYQDAILIGKLSVYACETVYGTEHFPKLDLEIAKLLKLAARPALL